jgi:phage-related baseplate assembly protein
VSNVDVSSGGIDEESDDSYRERIQLSPEKFTTAGSEDSYKYWAKTATQNILDVEVYSPAPAEVNVVALMQGGTLPTPTELELINGVLNSRKRRPLTDKVSVKSPKQVNYQIKLTYYLDTEDVMNVETLQTRINAAANQFVTWQKTKLGRNINPSKLINLVMQAGAERVEVTAPALQTLERYQVANCTTIIVNYGGLELS